MASQVAKVCKNFIRCGVSQQQMAAPCLSTVVHRRHCKMHHLCQFHYMNFFVDLSLWLCFLRNLVNYRDTKPWYLCHGPLVWPWRSVIIGSDETPHRTGWYHRTHKLSQTCFHQKHIKYFITVVKAGPAKGDCNTPNLLLIHMMNTFHRQQMFGQPVFWKVGDAFRSIWKNQNLRLIQSDQRSDGVIIIDMLRSAIW